MGAPQFTANQIVEALERAGGSRAKAARELGVNLCTIQKYIKRAEALGLEVPPSLYHAPTPDDLREAITPLHHGAPDGFTTKGVSSYHDGETGAVKGFWLKTDVDKERQKKIVEAAIAEMCLAIPAQEPIAAPAATTEKLCNTYVFTDYHMGMLAWWKEGGADWDLNIAEKVLMGCFEQMLARAPAARVGVLCQLGDFLHTDGLIPQTPTSHHTLDADSRFQKIVAVTIRCLRKIVNRMLEKHEVVHVLMAEGNHDIVSSIWLQQMFAAIYENEPRVKIIDSPLPYYAIQHGKVMLGFHHGHLKKFDQLARVMPAQFPQMWGLTTHRYCHSGHLHHIHEKEDYGIVLVQHPTLASRDAYAARGAYYAERGARCETYHEDWGQVGRTIVTPEMVL